MMPGPMTGGFATTGPDNRTYKRDRDGKFSGGSGGGGAAPDFDKLPTGAAAIAATQPYQEVLRAGDRSRAIGARERIRMEDAIHGSDGYTRLGYVDVNRALHAGALETAPPHLRQQVADIDRMMELGATTEDIAVHRGTSEPSLTLGSGFNPAGGNVGLEFTHNAYESTSARSTIAEEFARGHNASANYRSTTENHPTVISIHVPRGTPALQLTGMDRYPGEGDGEGYAEILLKRGLKHRVTADHGVVGGVHYLEAELVPDGG